MFEYMTVQDAAKLWGISVRRVQKLCEENRIDGIVRLPRAWLIPQDAQKPAMVDINKIKKQIYCRQQGEHTMSKLLLVEDDQSIVSSLSDYLGNEGFKIESASGQKEAIEKLDSDQYDLALVDIQLSNGNGFSVCSAIKERGTMPVIFLTASDDEYSVVAGLDMGADDYISKPFRPRELLSRINSVLRRTKNTQNIISYHDLVVDTNQATVSKNGEEILLSAMEYKLLLVFLRNKGIVLSRRRLLELLWDTTGEFINDNTLTVYMKRLRDKIETNPQEPEIIITVRGLGYKVG